MVSYLQLTSLRFYWLAKVEKGASVLGVMPCLNTAVKTCSHYLFQIKIIGKQNNQILDMVFHVFGTINYMVSSVSGLHICQSLAIIFTLLISGVVNCS